MNKIDIEKISEGNHKAYSELIETLEKVKDAIKKQNYGIAMDILCKPYPAFQVITLSSESKDEKIRKGIIKYLEQSHFGEEPYSIDDDTVRDYIDWLEKQGGKDEEILILKDQIESLHAAIKAIKETHRIELEKRGEQKPTEWSLPYGKNETAEQLIALAECLEMDGDCLFNRLSGDDYGKLLRVLARELTKPQQEWSEEDEKLLELSVENITELKDRFGKEYGRTGDCIEWLNSLKERYTWEPSDEQMDALRYVFQHYTPTATDTLAWDALQTIELMLEQLKK